MVPSKCEIRIKIQRNDPSFCLISHVDTHPYTIHLDEAFLLVKRHKIANSLKVAHELELQKEAMKFAVRRAEMKYYSKAAGHSDITIQNLTTGRIPRRIIFGIVTSSSFHGNIKTTPFNFIHCNITSIVLRKDSNTVPFETIEMNPAKNLYGQGYIALHQGSGHLLQDSDCAITPEMFSKGYCIIPLDISCGMSDLGEIDQVRHGTITLQIKLSTALTAPVILITYCEYDEVIQMDKDRQVTYR